MAMASMKMDAEERKEQTEVAYKPPPYPYGLCLNLDDKSLEKLGFKSPPAGGSTLVIHAKVTVQSTTTTMDDTGENESSSSWQITDMEVVTPSSSAAMAKQMYPDMKD